MGHDIDELKALLAERGVSFSHCCELAELERLLQETESRAGPTCGGEVAPSTTPDAGPSGAPAPAISVRELKAELTALGVDFSQCREKAELRELLTEARERQGPPSPGAVASSASGKELSDGGFAVRLSDGRRCWVEFIADEDALCHFDDGTDSIVTASDIEAAPELQGPRAFVGTFEAARAEAFRSGRLLVVAVLRTNAQGATDASLKPQYIQALVLASDEVAPLLEENAVFWRGAASELRGPQLQQLAPDGKLPSLAMVLPLASDAMRVLGHSPGVDKEALVIAFVEALEALAEHKDATQARLASESAQLRQEQDEEFAAALAADRQAQAEAEERRLAAAVASAPPQGDAEMTGEEKDEERRTKARRLLADEFLSGSPPPPATTEPETTGAGLTRLVLRLPSGERVERSFSSQEPLSRVIKWAECCSYLPEAAGRSLQIPSRFELATAFPPHRFGSDEAEKSLVALGLAPSAALLLIDTSA
mmetsp:Transcript_93111/g.208020  ORF Transcript_93111/g.208020 Transcript_93111/m.208020 type:complete len:483 (-) Transcript_93111:112-1560(-)